MTPAIEHLRALVAVAPPDATIPVRWLAELLDREAAGTAAGDTDAVAAGVDCTAAQLGERLGLAPSTVRTMCARGEFPGAYKRKGREWRIPAAAVSAMQARERARKSSATPRKPKPSAIGDWRAYLPAKGDQHASGVVT